MNVITKQNMKNKKENNDSSRVSGGKSKKKYEKMIIGKAKIQCLWQPREKNI